jgi:CBS domain-containing protein
MIIMSYSVKDYMDKEFPVLSAEETVVEAAKTLVSSDKSYVIILDKGKPKGIVTEEDLIEKVIVADKDPKTTKIGSIMSTPLITIGPDEDMLVASEIMQKNKVKKLPVVKEEIIYGVLTSTDIARSCGAYVDKATRDILRWSIPI